MRACVRIEDFVADPIGRWLVGDHHLIWCADPTRAGTVVWGRVGEAEAERIVAAWAFERRLQAPYQSVIDLGELSAVDPAAFDVVGGFMRAHLAALGRRIARQALVRPAGMPGAVVAGFYPRLGPAFEWRDFADGASAYAWCWPDEPALHHEVRALVAEARDASPLIARLRQHLRQNLRRPPALAAVARTLAVAPRSLQRALTQAHTSFRAEVQRARVDAACALLVDSDLKVETVAQRVGCASLPGFGRLFRSLTGESPAAYRARHRAG